MLRGAAASSRLPEAIPETYRVFLTARDINGRSANFSLPLLVSQPGPELFGGFPWRACWTTPLAVRNSIPRPHAPGKDKQAGAGEMVFGWQRSADPEDLMYSPLMSLADLDRLGLVHRETTPDAKPPESVQTDKAI